MATEIIESESRYSQALINDIIAFHQDLQTKNKEEKALQMIRSLQKEIHAMRLDIEELKRDEGGDEDSPDVAVM
jgi:hypothetical protein